MTRCFASHSVPHSAYALGKADLLKALTYAEEIDAPIHMHLHETAAEVEAAHRELGTSHIHYLAELGLLVPRLQAVHLTQVDDAELELLAESGVRAVHCPQSNLKLGSGTCDIERLKRRGLIVGLGTDGAAANNTLDLFTELRVAALLAKTITGDPSALGAFDALEFATLGSARALGLDATIGSIEARQSRRPDFRGPHLLRGATRASSRGDVGIRGFRQPRPQRLDRRPARAGRRQTGDVGRSGDSCARHALDDAARRAGMMSRHSIRARDAS